MMPSSEKKHIRLLLTGGGTGGHLFPAIAAAEEMCTMMPGSKVMFIGTRRKLDSTSLAAYGYEVDSIISFGLKGKNLLDLLKALIVIPVSLIQAMMKIIAFQPDVVLGVGGYVTGPVIAAAKLLGKKTIIHEQNSIPGLANRKLGGMADRICISLPQSAGYFSSDKTILTGNPVRKAILELAEKHNKNSSREIITMLVLGGSQGAHKINELVVEAICEHGVTGDLRIIHQTGNDDCDMVRKAYGAQGIDSIVEPFFHDMAAIYREADFLISRAGATTLAELAVLGKPAVLIPYPSAADDHQQKNAEYYVAGGGCTKMLENELTGSLLAEQINDFIIDTDRIPKMSERMKKLGKPHAAKEIVNVCLASITNKAA